MNILILSRKPEIYSTQRMVEEARLRGHDVSIWDPEASASLCSFPVEILIPRLSHWFFNEALTTVREFESRGVRSFNSSQAYVASRNKWLLYQKLREWNMPTPESSLLKKGESTLVAFPKVLKQLSSSQGEGIYLAQNSEDLEQIRARHPEEDLLIQEWIKEFSGRDIRAFVVGGRVVASMKRIAAEGEFRSNLHRGGHAENCALTAEEEKLALDLCSRLNLHIAGIDFLRSHKGSLLLEANPCPGLEGIENCTKINIAREIIQHLETQI